MRKYKKIRYIGGMISLIFIPIIFWFSTKSTLEKLNLRVLDLGLPYKSKKGEKVPENFTIPIEGYKYQTINLPNNFDEKIEKEYFNKIKKLQKVNVDKTGIKFQLSDKNNYNDLVRIINLMLKTKQDFWGLDTEKTNAFYVIHRKFEYSNEEGCLLCNDLIVEYIDQTDSNNKYSTILKKLIIHSPKEIYYLLLGFLFLVYTSVNRLIKFNKDNTAVNIGNRCTTSIIR